MHSIRECGDVKAVEACQRLFQVRVAARCVELPRLFAFKEIFANYGVERSKFAVRDA